MESAKDPSFAAGHGIGAAEHKGDAVLLSQ